MEIAKQFLALHKRGHVMHGDLSEDNILCRGKAIRIIDFKYASAHDCQCVGMPVHGKLQPFGCEYGCEEMRTVVERLQIWDDGRMNIVDLVHCTHFRLSRPFQDWGHLISKRLDESGSDRATT